MKTDLNKGIQNIGYIHLNLPTKIDIDDNLNSGTISYIYDATVVKQKKIVNNGTTTEYAGNYIYTNDLLKFFNHAEGYEDAENNFDYVYQYKDHLGNVRLSYSDTDGNSTINATTEIVEENNYYPFGLKHKGYNSTVTFTNLALKKKFGGKEYQDELGLGWYDITARNYDPALGRWMNLDPLAEQMRRWSPYNYAFDNPLRFTDPDGMWPFPNPVAAIGERIARSFRSIIGSSSKRASTSSTSSQNRGPRANNTKHRSKKGSSLHVPVGVILTGNSSDGSVVDNPNGITADKTISVEISVVKDIVGVIKKGSKFDSKASPSMLQGETITDSGNSNDEINTSENSSIETSNQVEVEIPGQLGIETNSLLGPSVAIPQTKKDTLMDEKDVSSFMTKSPCTISAGVCYQD